MNTKSKKQAKSEAYDLLKTHLKDCGPEGNSVVLIDHVDGNATNTGRSDYLTVRVMTVHNGRPSTAGWLDSLFCTAIGYRFNRKRECITMPGCGFNKSHEIASALARVAGHPVTCEGSWSGVAKP